MAELRSIEVARHGTALAVEDEHGHRTVRRVDLVDVLGEPPGAATRRFAAARIEGDGAVVTFADGDEERLPASALVPPHLLPELVVTGAGQLVTCDGDGGDPLNIIADGAVICGAGRVLWVGPEDELSRSGFDLADTRRVDAGGRLVTPGLVDCHAHPIFAGNRADEFSRRARGEDYQSIAAAGGGINATLAPTRAASFDELVAGVCERAARALSWGTTTMEAKSGYDLTAKGELRLLEVALAADALQPVHLTPTLLGAHLVPAEYADDRDAYIAEICERMIPAAAKHALARAADVYCDEGAFSLDETRRILACAERAGLPVRAHVGQFADLGAAELLAELGALSADHLENVSDTGIRALAAAGVVAVMLPGACVQLRMQPPPVAALRAAGVPLAVASDLNPGTAHSETLAVPMWLATTHYGMTVEEAWLGVTTHAARALARQDLGLLAPGACADLVIWDAEIPADIPYHFGVNLASIVIKHGRIVRE